MGNLAAWVKASGMKSGGYPREKLARAWRNAGDSMATKRAIADRATQHANRLTEVAKASGTSGAHEKAAEAHDHASTLHERLGNDAVAEKHVDMSVAHERESKGESHGGTFDDVHPRDERGRFVSK